MIALEAAAIPGARILPRAPGLPDSWFAGDGQLTKREVRAVTLSALAPCRGQHLWDLGAGCGSISIEWMLADPSCRATAVEMRADRAAYIAQKRWGCSACRALRWSTATSSLPCRRSQNRTPCSSAAARASA